MNELEVHISFIRRIFKGLHQILDKADDIRLTKLQDKLSFINFPYVHQLVNQPENTFCIPMHDLIKIDFLRIFLAWN